MSCQRMKGMHVVKGEPGAPYLDPFIEPMLAVNAAFREMYRKTLRSASPKARHEHVTEGLDCWCQPIVLAYGDEPVCDNEGNLIAVESDD